MSQPGLDEPGWSYWDQEAWVDLPGSQCDNLGNQSPLDLRGSPDTSVWLPMEEVGHVVRLGPINRTVLPGWPRYPIVWNYTWPIVQVALEDGSAGPQAQLLSPYNETTRVTFFQKDYYLQGVRFASPSEHQLEGASCDMEAQYLHRARDGQLLVTAALLRVGLVPDNAFVEQLWEGLGKLGDDSGPVTLVVPNPFYGGLPADRSLFAYNGSLTHPLCSTKVGSEVVWLVFRQPILVSRRQRDEFRQKLQDLLGDRLRMETKSPKGVIEPWNLSLGTNNRALQLQGTRIVISLNVTQAPPKPEPSGLLGGPDAWAYAALGLLAAVVLLGSVLLVGCLCCRTCVGGVLRRKALSRSRELLSDASTDAEDESGSDGRGGSGGSSSPLSGRR